MQKKTQKTVMENPQKWFFSWVEIFSIVVIQFFFIFKHEKAIVRLFINLNVAWARNLILHHAALLQ